MTARELERMVRRWQSLLGLDRWHLTLDFSEPAPDGGHAATWRSNQYETGRLCFDPRWTNWSAEEAEYHVVHELVHLMTRDLEEVWKMIDEQLPPAVDRPIRAAFDFRIEQLVDLLARRLINVRSSDA